jgi:hypothetical protein
LVEIDKGGVLFMMKKYIVGKSMALALVGLCLSSVPSRAIGGYMVIVSSTKSGSSFDGRSAAAAADCGVETAEAQTHAGSGFRPGLTILFSGPYSSRSLAEAALRRVRPCVPDAYVKPGFL